MLGLPPASLQSDWYLPTVVVAAFVGMLLAAPLQRVNAVIVGLDALVIGLFGAFGTSKALSLGGARRPPAIFVGICSAVAAASCATCS